ncbi:MAG: methyltransferase domain-containing protein [Actinobacteria bacterium]|nr:methyltransferase domain-containing protein [Actinomycetota bacterium]
MNARPPLRSFGQVFDGIATEYDAHRPGYPAELVDAALARHAGETVVEVGCGTGKLTELLAARDLRVDAVDPGPSMIEVAKRRVGDAANVRFHVARFEDVDLPAGAYSALFSATAFHWVDPRVGWRKAAALLEPGGVLALLMHQHVRDEQSDEQERAFRSILRTYAPEVEETLPRLRALDELLAGAEARRANASTIWDSLMGHAHDLSVPEAAELFTDVELTTTVEKIEQTTDELWAQFRTTSLYFRIDPSRRAAFEADDRRNLEGFGGRLTSSQAAILMTARRV